MMKKALSAVEMQEQDRRAIENIGIPAVCLMENAGRLVADEVRKLLKGRPCRVTVVCGSGNNGGDGFVAARHILNQGGDVAVLLAGEQARFTDETLGNFLIVKNLNIPVLSSDAQGLAVLGRSGLIVDALFGVGLSRTVRGRCGDVIRAVNASRATVVSVDVPSGIDATTGEVLGVGVRADLTVTLAYPKQGLYRAQGPRYAGRIKVVDIGIPYEGVHG